MDVIGLVLHGDGDGCRVPFIVVDRELLGWAGELMVCHDVLSP